MRAVALSGGADSVVVFHKMLKEGKLDCAIHMNYNLRGEESTRDMNFCIDLCAKYNVPLNLHIVENVEQNAKESGKGVEEYARDLRYSIFNDSKYTTVYIGHHKDDLVETLLFRLIRGTGLNGITPMQEVSGKFIRPILDMTKQDVLDYISKEGLSYITDSSNLKNDYDRNLIRNQILPLMTQINTKAVENIVSFMNTASELYSEIKSVNEENVENLLKSGLDLSVLESMSRSSKHTLFLEAMKSLDDKEFYLGKGDFQELLKLCSPNTNSSAFRQVRNVYFVRKRNRLRVVINRYLDRNPKNIEEMGIRNLKVFTSFVEINDYLIERTKVNNLEIRKFKSGDIIKINNMTKKVSDYLTEKGVHSFEKQYVSVLASDNEVYWVDLIK